MLVRLRTAAIAAVALIICGAAPAQDYPIRTISLVVPYPPGGGVDAMARVVAEKLTATLGQQVVVDNRAGGSGLVGTRNFLKSAPDGYTLFLGHTGSIAINPSLYANAGFDPRKDFAPIGLIASMPVALLAHPSFPAKTIGEVVAIAKREGSKLNIGTSAVGTGGYLSAELFKATAGIDATIIPYKGTGQVMNDLLGNHVPIAFGVLPPALGNLQAGTLRAIAVLSPVRFSLLPEVPTADESGLPGFESVRPRARLDRSSRGSTQRCERWWRPERWSSVSLPKAAIRSPRRPRNMPRTSTAKKRSGARWCASSI
jgi:tripartite-type tricarboxylate transporter receptor subunit TctC